MLKICLTGGPCGGKSTIFSHLSQMLEDRGYYVFRIEECATELILNGISPNNNLSLLDFQKFVLDDQLKKEQLYAKLSKFYPNDKIIIFCDRGIMDSCAYITKEEYEPLLKEHNMTFADAFAHYDAVLHLVTAADGAEKYYQWNDPNKEDCGNNAARSESPEEARIKDKKTLNAWIGHPHLRVFDNSTNFEGKIKKVIEEVFALLGEPVPTEIERKFLIKKPTQEQIELLGCVSKTNIIQTYLKSNNSNIERRVRQRGTKKDGFNFYYTEKIIIGPGERIENERKITLEEYVNYLADTDTSLHQISKIRRCFMFDNKYYEMDIYPFSEEYAILEIELNNINEPIKLPPLEIIKEVTDDENHKNYYLAKNLKLE